jgi:hypothetical protein
MTVSVEQQAAAVEIAAVNLRGHIDNLHRLIALKKRGPAELDIFVDRLPAMEAAAKTLRWLANNETLIRKAVA